MPVNAQRDGGRPMTEAAADSQNVYARGDQLRRVVMSQAVQRDMWHFDLFHAHRPFVGERVGIADLSQNTSPSSGTFPSPSLSRISCCACRWALSRRGGIALSHRYAVA